MEEKNNELLKNNLDKAEEKRMLLEEILAKNSTDLMIRAQVEATKKTMEDSTIDIKEQIKIEFKKIVKEVLNEKYIQSQKDKEVALNYAKKENNKKIYKRAAQIYNEIGDNERKGRNQIQRINPELINEYRNKLKQEKEEETQKLSHNPVAKDKQLKVIEDNGFIGKIKDILSKVFSSPNRNNNLTDKPKDSDIESKSKKREKGSKGNKKKNKKKNKNKRKIKIIIKGEKKKLTSNDIYRNEIAKNNPLSEKLKHQGTLINQVEKAKKEEMNQEK